MPVFSINQVGDEWEVLGPDGARLGDLHGSYAEALSFIGGMLALGAQLAEGDGTDGGAESADGLLPETWEDVEGICFSEATGDGRDFSSCTWSARDPQVSLLPLMLQTSTDFGHFGAELAGYMAEITDTGASTTPRANGRFYDSEAGRQFRDMLLDGRRFGVSVDPGRVSVEWVCTDEDADGYCIAEAAQFTDYEIIGLTGTPFPAFERAAIQLGTPATQQAAAASSPPVAIAASAHGVSLERPPTAWFTIPEPQLGEAFALGDLGDEWLVDQGQGRLAMPLTITDDGQVAGHLAVWGQCHTGYPGMCVTPPVGDAAYAHFHIGEVHTADGSRLAVGALSAGCDHALVTMRAPEARDHYAHNGIAWADVRISNGEHGPWVAGALRPGVTEAQLRVLRAGALSGDWRRLGGRMELVAALAVTTPGFPITREAILASGLAVAAPPRMQAALDGGQQQALVASGIVRRCPECARRGAQQLGRTGGENPTVVQQQAAILDHLRVLERRTRHLIPAEAAHQAARLTR
jgi:hypothetical protein